MGKLQQFRDPHLSLWQSAADEVVARRRTGSRALDTGEPGTVTRPELDDSMTRAAVEEAKAVEEARAKGQTEPLPPATAPRLATEAVGDVARYCATVARNYGVALITGNKTDQDRYRTQLSKQFGDCDPGWVEVSVKYAEFVASQGQVPYRRHQKLGDFVIDGKLPANARVALVGDWATGQPEAKTVLAQIARKNPHVVIHMGDIYYSGTEFEIDSYFYKIWSQILDLSKTPTFTLSGNHDMFSGGAPYYQLIDKLGQPASYFCLRNDAWQFVAIDTGLHDRSPLAAEPTYLEDTELEWLADKVQNRGSRRTVLLSHHQLFSAFEDICGKPVNDRLNGQLAQLLPGVDVWFWGHEHDLVVYKRYLGVLARCIGHGAFPVALAEIPQSPKHAEVPVDLDVRLGGDIFYNHGYVIMDLQGAAATVSYFQDTDEDTAQFTETLESARSVTS